MTEKNDFKLEPVQARGEELWTQDLESVKGNALKLIKESKLVEAIDCLMTSYIQRMPDNPEKEKKIREYGNLRAKGNLTVEEVTEYIEKF